MELFDFIVPLYNLVVNGYSNARECAHVFADNLLISLYDHQVLCIWVANEERFIPFDLKVQGQSRHWKNLVHTLKITISFDDHQTFYASWAWKEKETDWFQRSRSKGHVFKNFTVTVELGLFQDIGAEEMDYAYWFSRPYLRIGGH